MRAFSLVELSIVLVILGLLVGGILAGQSLIRASQLRAVTTEHARYVGAIYAFRDRYFALPGDFRDATKVWGQSPHCPGTHEQGTTDGTTCDGNGDGLIYFTGLYTAPTANELFRFWQHLASAGLIEGSYNGVTAASNGYFYGAGPQNVPASKFPNAHWSVSYADNRSGAWSPTLFGYEFAPFFLMLGKLHASGASAPINEGIVRGSEAWNIDMKMDDGQPGRGKLLSRVGNSCNSAANSTAYDATYNLTHTENRCFLQFKF